MQSVLPPLSFLLHSFLPPFFFVILQSWSRVLCPQLNHLPIYLSANGLILSHSLSIVGDTMCRIPSLWHVQLPLPIPSPMGGTRRACPKGALGSILS